MSTHQTPTNAFTAFFHKTSIANAATPGEAPQSEPSAIATNPIPSSEASSSDFYTHAHPTALVDYNEAKKKKLKERLAKHITSNASSVQNNNKNKQKFSKRLSISSNNNIVPVLCELTGAVSALMVPAIPNTKQNPANNPIVLTYISPYGIYENARSFAQAGGTYLKQLDTQILAALSITLADNYDLFVYSPTDSGVQKNAVLRTVDKDTLIDCILLIEEMINSGNYSFLPKLSIRIDTDVVQDGIAVRMRNWLKLVVERIYEPDTQSYDEAMTLNKLDNKPTIAKAKREKIALHREFREFKSEAKIIIANLYKAQKISGKLKLFLMTVITGQHLSQAAPEMVTLLCNKLSLIDSTDAIELADSIDFFYNKLQDEDNEFDAPSLTTFANLPVGKYVDEVNEEDEFAVKSSKVLPNFDEVSKVKPVSVLVEGEKKMSFIERIRMLKAQQNQATTPVTKQENDDAPF